MTAWNGPDIRTAGGHLGTPIGRCIAGEEIEGEACPVRFVVHKNCYRELTLGMDFLYEYGAVTDLDSNSLTLQTPEAPQNHLTPKSPSARIADEHVKLPPHASAFLLVKVS